ncbi:MAG TPA: cupin domain-containing protein [Pyrinomonadaceae bacterium]|nr:cupin domain-containing protein [Pyrinomonadaceae bacterium]
MKRTAILLAIPALVLSAALAGRAQNAQAGKQSQIILRAGSQPPSKGSAENFTGNVTVTPLFPADASAPYSGAYVTFEAGARSAWHMHPAGQRLVVTAGAGRTAEWGGGVQEIKAGDVIWCPPGVKHWHGASPTTAMTHLALTNTVNNKAVEWMEKVTDAQYNAGSASVPPRRSDERRAHRSTDAGLHLRARGRGRRKGIRKRRRGADHCLEQQEVTFHLHQRGDRITN